MKKLSLLSVMACLTVVLSCTKPSDQNNGSVPPSATSLTAYGVSTTKVKLSWTDNSSNEDGFKIERKTAGTTFNVIGTVGTNIRSYIDSGLSQNVTYTYRVIPFNGSGGSNTYSNEVSINTGGSNPPSLTDTVGNCSQIWMTKNLDVAYYSNGDPIPQVTDPEQWQNLTTGAWCYYNNDPTTGAIYGKLYNWYAVNDPRGLAPTGWHMPSLPEYQTLRDCLAGKLVAGGKMKEVGTVHWLSPNAGATNSSKFTALPGGARYYSGSTKDVIFNLLGESGKWYCSTHFTNGSSHFITYIGLSNNTSEISEVIVASNVNAFYNNGYSVRCVKGPSISISVTTTPASGINSTGATSGGYVTDDGGYSVTSRGVVWSTSPDPTINLSSKTSNGVGLGSFTSNVTGLSPNTIYYLRAYATNITGTAYGSQDTINTVNYTLPTISTAVVSLLTQTTSVCGGTITNTGANPISERGVVWSTSPNPTISLLTRTYDGAGPGIFTSHISGLSGNTTYYIRAYATNSAGTAYGSQVTFKTLSDPSVAICEQVWMIKNLDVAYYSNGDPIPQVTDSAQWQNLTTGAWCYFNNDPAMGEVYGKLYNWYAVNDSRGLAPGGWHIPSDVEWGSLISCLNTAGNSCIPGTDYVTLRSTNAKLQSTGTIEQGTGLWHLTTLYTATNSSGFTALPGASRYGGGGPDGFQQALGYYGAFWASTLSNQFPVYLAEGIAIGPSAQDLCIGGESKTNGRYVRCVRQ